MIAALVLPGCEFKGEGAAATQPADRPYWTPTVTAMRVYPSTRFVRENGQVTLNARIELLDEMSDPTKASGTMRFGLFTAQQGGETTGRRLYQWNVSLQTLADQREYFDSVTLAYSFPLELDNTDITDRTTILRAAFIRASDGGRVQTQFVVDQ